MAELIVMPDVEDLTRRFLDSELGDGTAYTGTAPSTWPPRSVYIRRTGGTTTDLVVDRAQITLECRAALAGTATHLAAHVRALLSAAGRDGWLLEVPLLDVVEVSGPYLDPDPISPKLQRYTQTFVLAVRGEVSTITSPEGGTP